MDQIYVYKIKLKLVVYEIKWTCLDTEFLWNELHGNGVK